MENKSFTSSGWTDGDSTPSIDSIVMISLLSSQIPSTQRSSNRCLVCHICLWLHFRFLPKRCSALIIMIYNNQSQSFHLWSLNSNCFHCFSQYFLWVLCMLKKTSKFEVYIPNDITQIDIPFLSGGGFLLRTRTGRVVSQNIRTLSYQYCSSAKAIQ